MTQHQANTDSGPHPSAPITTSAGPVDENECRERLAHVEDQWRRAQADLENLQKRFQRELTRGRTAERERTLGALLLTVDDLERAISHAKSSDDALLNGVRVITDGAAAAIASFGYPRFGEPGDSYDPQLHEVLSTVPATANTRANVIVAVVRFGYGTVDQLLRAASVVVAKEAD